MRGSLSQGFASALSASLPAGLATAGLLGAVALGTLSTVAVPMAAAHSHPAPASMTIAQQPARATIVKPAVAAKPKAVAPRATRSLVRAPITHEITHVVPIGPVESGIASWYGPGFAGRRTSSGETFDPSQMTAAHKYLPFGTMAKVCTTFGTCVIVRITDRGPFVPGRIVDLSAAAHDALHMGGLAQVTLTPIGTHIVTETIVDQPAVYADVPAPVAPAAPRASRSQARTRLVAGEQHVVRSAAAPSAARVPVKTTAVIAPKGTHGDLNENPVAALAPLAILAGFGAFRGKFRLELDETLALPEDQ